MHPSPPLAPNETNWVVQIDEDLKSKVSNDQRHWDKRSIYRVRTCVDDLESSAYRPQVVSFGPYYHGHPRLRPMEEHKRRALFRFLERSRMPLKPFLESLRDVAWDLQESYDDLDQGLKEGSGEDAAGWFLQLMITDGCFMLEILRFANEEVNDYAPNDPIFSDHGRLYMLPVIRRDMMLLENQLPMLVLDRLVSVCDGEKEDEYINRLILHFCCSTSPNSRRMGKCLHALDVVRKNLVQPTLDKEVSKGSPNNSCMGKCLHILDVFGKILLMVSKKDKRRKSKGAIPPATELREHGIQFKLSGTNSLTDISFASGVLRLPMIAVHDTAESMFLNLIAFERFHVGAGKPHPQGARDYAGQPHRQGPLGPCADVEAGTEVTSYIYLMDSLIDKGQDVALLRNKGIIENYMESDEATAKLFNSLAKDVRLDPHSSLHRVISNVRKYCKKSWPDGRANLMALIHTNCGELWVIIIFSLIGGFFLFVLTAIQTVYTVLGYKK